MKNICIVHLCSRVLIKSPTFNPTKLVVITVVFLIKSIGRTFLDLNQKTNFSDKRFIPTVVLRLSEMNRSLGPCVVVRTILFTLSNVYDL